MTDRTHRMISRTRVLFFAAVSSSVLCSSAHAQQLADPQLESTVWAEGLSFPTAFVFLPTAPSAPLEVLINEKGTGRVQHYRAGVFQSTTLDLHVNSWGEQGLLGIELHPDFSSNSFVYLYYTASPTGQDVPQSTPALENRVARFTWNGSSLVDEVVLMRLPSSAAHHIGGVLTFGPDDMLYGIIGNVGRGGQLQNIANGDPPDTTSIVFRIRDDGTIPSDNPFAAMGAAMQYTYGYGVRNSYGIDFDPLSNVLWETENGPDQYDELNRFEGGFNGGFARILGPESRSPATLDDLWQAPGSHYSDPQLSWLSPISAAAIHFLRSDSLGTDYRNDCFVGAYNTQSIYHFELEPDRSGLVLPTAALEDSVADTSSERDAFLWASGFGGGIVWLDTGPDGALYALAFDNGRLYRIAPDTTTTDSEIDPRPSVRFVAHPNPFNRSTRIGLTQSSPVAHVLRIYSASGRLVRGFEGVGPFVWDGLDQSGRRVGSGVYVARIRLGNSGRTHEQKIVRVP